MTIWRADSGRPSPPRRSRGVDSRSPGSPSTRSASKAITGTPVSTVAITIASSSRFWLWNPPRFMRSSAISSGAVRRSSGSIPTWRKKTR
jgi:hypothetical protein